MDEKAKKAIAQDDDKFKWFVIETLFHFKGELSSLRTKSKIWGAVAGVISGAAVAGVVKVFVEK